MRRLVFLAAARDDLADILRHIATESTDLAVARTFVDGMVDHCGRLAALPGTLGSARPELRPDIRSVPHQGYVIFFRYAAERLEIVNVLHGHRDLGAHFGN